MKIEHILKLARVQIKGAEKDSIEKDFSSIINFVKKIEKLETNKVKPMSYPVDIYNAVREDKTINGKKSRSKVGTPTEASEQMTNNKKLIDAAPDKKDNYVKVKEVFK